MSDQNRKQQNCGKHCRSASISAVALLPGRFFQALRLASLAHHEQYRLDGSPALWHPIEVCFQLQLHGIQDVDLLCAGLLHDALEDNPKRHESLLALIRDHLGQSVANWVEMLTDDPSLPGSLARKEAQLRKIYVAPEEVQTIKLADRLANLLSGPAPTWNSAKCTAYARHSRQLLHATGTPHAELHRSILAALDASPWKEFGQTCEPNTPSADT